MNKKEFILKLVDVIVSAICFFVIVCVCFFSGFVFGSSRNFNNDSSENLSVSCSLSPADVSTPSYSFQSSAIPMIFTPFPANTSAPYEYNFTLQQFLPFTFNLSSSGVVISIRGISHSFDNFTALDWWTKFDFLDGPTSDNQRRIFGIYYKSTDFSFDVVRFTYGCDTVYYGDSRFRTSFIQFFDSAGRSFGFQFCYYSDSYGPANFIPMRDYYLTPNLSDNDIYRSGYETGYQNGVIIGENTGYIDGYSNGYDDGLIDGYDNGVASANDYSFASLLTSVVGAPVTVFIDLLDFNIMGYSLLNIVMGLLTLGIVVLIIKLCLGGK